MKNKTAMEIMLEHKEPVCVVNEAIFKYYLEKDLIDEETFKRAKKGELVFLKGFRCYMNTNIDDNS